jgi:aryl-alcohol dehydrogenase-like predicted oxidoreductase/histidinol phosphatase-like enzyme
MGCMRLSTERDRDEAQAIDVLHAALDAGVTVLDTADAYGWDEREIGHNERLIARALAGWSGDPSRIVIGTKGGLTRPQGRWIPDGRAGHLAAACEASLRALRVDRIPLYQLHAPDPRTPLSTSVRALASLKRNGLIEHIGLCNVTVGQIEEARRIADIDAVQVELSIWNDDNLLSGVAAYCAANQIRLIAHRPLGGPRRARRLTSDPLLDDLAARHDVSRYDIALAWLVDLSNMIVPIAGATRVETARALGRLHAVRLTDDDRARLDERFPSGRLLRRPGPLELVTICKVSGTVPGTVPGTVSGTVPGTVPGTVSDTEVVLIMGLPAAGKTAAAQTFVSKGYTRLNRDEDGGSLRGLLPRLNRLLESGVSRLVLDNTYVSRKSRASVIQSAARAGLPVRCIWLQTSTEDAQVNASERMLSKYGRLLGPEEMRRAARTDVSAFGPAVQFGYQRDLEPPHPDEGFSAIDIVPFERRRDPSCGTRAIVLWCDDVLLRSRSGRRSPTSPEDVEVVGDHRDALRQYLADGWRLLGLSWRPEIAEEAMSVEEVDACFERMIAELGVPIDVRYCPHGGGPPVCWCRKPLPGLGAVFIQQYRLDPAHCIYVGRGPQDRGFARRLGFQYREADAFFSQRSA